MYKYEKSSYHFKRMIQILLHIQEYKDDEGLYQ